MDQPIVIKPNSLADVIQAMFVQKMLAYIQHVVNPKDYKNLYDLTQRCNEVWECRTAQKTSTQRS